MLFSRLFFVTVASLIGFAGSLSAQVVISEIMADNLSTALVDEDADREDWIELRNAGSTAVNLNGWYLTDEGNPADPNRNLRKWQFPVTTPVISLAPESYIRIWCSGKNRKAVSTKLHTNFKLSSSGEYLAVVQPDGTTVSHGFLPYPAQFPNGTYGTAFGLISTVVHPELGSVKYKVPTSLADFTANFTGWNTVGFDDSSWSTGTGGLGMGTVFAGLFATDTTSVMLNLNRSCFVRCTFNLAPGIAPAAVRLKVKFDDGYVAYLNGTEIDSFRKPSPLAWNSGTLANLGRNDADAANFYSAPALINNPNTLFQTGTNVLAFQWANENVANPNALMRPQLEIDVAGGVTNGYLVSATPGAINSSVTTVVGPSIIQTTESPPQPVGGGASAPLVITSRVTPTVNPLHGTTPVILRYRIMFGAEAGITMLDDGLGAGSASGDLVPNDGIFSCKVPTTAMTAGQMIRWRIEARDSNGIYTYDPPYPLFSNSTPPSNPTPDQSTEFEQYFGTVAEPAATGSTLPLLHWFITGTDNTGSNTVPNSTYPGTRCSFFFKPLPKDNPGPGYVAPKGRFYDNVLVNLHGQSTSGFAKKSHDLSFSRDKKFRWKDGEPDASGTNILSNFADKTKVRNTVAWEAFNHSNHLASHYCQLIRVHQNGSFKGLYDLVENANEAFLRREKLDDVTGALYKVYNRLQSATITTDNSSVEKKNPDDGNSADLAIFVNGIADTNTMTNRLRFFYDNADIASAINWLATQSITLARDFGHKNYYIYRDTAGTGEWSMLPWDQDLSLGHTWTGTGGGYFNDDIHSQGPLNCAAAQDNRVIQIINGTPELNAMFVRRLRTLADGFYGSPTETNSILTQRINALINQIDPNPNNPATGNDDADLDMRAWGYWTDGSNAVVPYTNASVLDHTVRAQGARVTHFNPIPPYPGTGPVYGDWGDGSTSLLPFVTGRRDFYFNPTPPINNGMAFPASQVANPALVIEQITPNPTTGLPAVLPAGATPQSFEYFVIRNTSNAAVDISGWKIDGDAEMVFRGGTVIPAQGATTTQATNAAYVNQLIVANRPSFFRQRVASPMTNEYRFVTGPYDRQLSARGGSITLSKPIDPVNLAAGYTLVVSQSYTGTPTAIQNALRVSEINFRPAPATAGELAILAGLVPSDFEFVELINTSGATLNLSGATFEEGIEFTFPASFTLAANARCLVVASQAAYEARYGTGHPIAGEFQGNLDNGGERLRIVDPIGEEVLDFTYDDDWFPVPAGQYRSFVTRSANPAYNSYDSPTTWALSETQNGTPSGGDSQNSRVFEGWRWDHFTLAEIPTLLDPNTVGALTADPDADGLNNFAEFAFGRLPRTADHPGSLATGGRVNHAGTDHLCVTFRRAKNALDVTYLVEVNPDITNAGGWTNAGVFVSATDVGNGVEEVCFRDTTPIGTAPRFMRVRAVKP